jgi:hypothetical protein
MNPLLGLLLSICPNEARNNMAHINFHGFKLVHHDGEKAILKKGPHEMHLAVKSLHPGNQAELAKIPLHKDYHKGGETKKQSNPKLEESKKTPHDPKLQQLPGKANSAQMGPYGRELVNPGDSKTMCEGGSMTPHYDEGGEIPINLNSPQMPPNMINPNPGANAGALTQQTTEYDTPFQDQPQTPKNTPPLPNTPSSTPTSSGSPTPTSSNQGPQLPQPQDYGSQLAQATSKQIGHEGKNGETGTGMAGEAQALGEQAKAQAAALQPGIDAQQEIKNHIDQVTTQHSAEIQSVVDDIKNSHIDPNRYMSSMGTESRMATGIGLILGGVGSGVTGGPNMALDFLNKQIDRDIQGQQAEIGKKENLVSLYSKMLGNERDGATMASSVLARITADKVMQAAQQSQDPIVKTRAQASAQALIASRLQAQQSLDMTQGLLNASKSMSKDGPTNDAKMQNILGYLRVAKPDMAKEMESRYVPGLGNASVPIPDKDRTELATKATGLKMAQDLRSWAQQNTGSLNPATVNEGKAKATAMLNYYRTATDQGVIKPSELEFDSKIVDSDPTKFFNKFRVDPKYKTLEDSMTKDLNSKREQYGLPQVKNTANTTTQTPETRMVKGVQYHKVPGGWQKS